MRFWYELQPEDKTRRRFVEKRKRLDAIDDFINRLGHRITTILLEIFISMKQELKENLAGVIGLITLFAIGFCIGSEYYAMAPWVFIGGLIGILIVSKAKETK